MVFVKIALTLLLLLVGGYEFLDIGVSKLEFIEGWKQGVLSEMTGYAALSLQQLFILTVLGYALHNMWKVRPQS